MEKVLVTGGAGFLGSHLCELLLSQHKSVVCVDNLITGSEKNIEHLKDNTQFRFINHDLIKPLDSLISELSDATAIFHLASPASPNKNSPRSYINYPLETMLVNSQGTQHLLELAKKTGAKFLFTSTSEVYGDPDHSPQEETYNGNVNPNGVRSVYDEAKRFGEALTFLYFRKYDIDVRIVRLFNTYGPHMQVDDGRMISNFINQAIRGNPLTIYGDGKQTRSCCYVSDTVGGIERAMFADNTTGEVINLGNPDERSILEIAMLIKHLTESRSEIVYESLPEDDPMQRRPDIMKAGKLLGFTPNVTLEEGLKKTIEYFKSVQ